MLTIYGQGGSQPSRAVWWACLIKSLPFELCEVRIDQFGPDGPLAKLNPTGQVPTIQDGDFILYEMPAILAYLCEKHRWADLYPSDVELRARINQYLHFHHNRTRNLTFELMAPHVVVAFLDFIKERGGESDAASDFLQRSTHPDKLARGQNAVREILRLIELGYFRNTTYLCTEDPSIADIACYEEVAQLKWANLFNLRVGQDRRVDLRRRDLLAAAVDHLLNAAGQGQVPVFVNRPFITGVEPAVNEGRLIGAVVVLVAGEYLVAPGDDLTQRAGAGKGTVRRHDRHFI